GIRSHPSLPPELSLKSQVQSVVVEAGIFLIVGLIPVALLTARKSNVVRPPPLPEASEGEQSQQLRRLAWASLLVWVIILPFTQREQLLRTSVERAFREGRIADALAVMSAHQLSDFPPYWQPPPRLESQQFAPKPLDIMEVISYSAPAPWVRAVYVEKF